MDAVTKEEKTCSCCADRSVGERLQMVEQAVGRSNGRWGSLGRAWDARGCVGRACDAQEPKTSKRSRMRHDARTQGVSRLDG